MIGQFIGHYYVRPVDLAIPQREQLSRHMSPNAQSKRASQASLGFCPYTKWLDDGKISDKANLRLGSETYCNPYMWIRGFFNSSFALATKTSTSSFFHDKT